MPSSVFANYHCDPCTMVRLPDCKLEVPGKQLLHMWGRLLMPDPLIPLFGSGTMHSVALFYMKFSLLIKHYTPKASCCSKGNM